MARIVYGGIATSIRGSVGGTTFQKNKFGYTVKNKPKMVLPLSPDQELTKLIMRKMTNLWRTLTDAERASWNLYASTYPQYSEHNPSVQLTGYNLYVMWGFQYLLATFVENSPWSEVAISLPAQPVLNFHVYSPSATELIIQPQFAPTSPDWYCNMFITPPVPASVNFVLSKHRFIAMVTSDVPSIDISSEYASKFGKIPTVGSKISIKYVLFPVWGGRVCAALFQVVTVASTPV